MLRFLRVASGIGVVALGAAGCSMFPDLDGLSSGDGGQPYDASTGGDSGPDSASDAASDAGTVSDAGADADASCTCTNLVSAYRFSDPNNLGHDLFGNNNMAAYKGTPKQSTTTPPGFGGYSIQLDGSSSVCTPGGFTFDSTADHTLCFWSQATVLADSTNQFAQACGYDTWTTSGGVDYLWRINNCNGGTPADLKVPGVYSAGKWVQICQTYTRAALKRTVVLNGQTSNKVSLTDTVPIVMSPGSNWCIGAYGTGGFWTGLIYLPMWFNRVLSDAEIEQVNARGCCLP